MHDSIEEHLKTYFNLVEHLGFRAELRVSGDLVIEGPDEATREVLRSLGEDLLRGWKLRQRNTYLESELKTLDKAERELRLKETGLRRLLDLSPFFILVESADEALQYINQSMENLLGRDFEDVFGQRIEEIASEFSFFKECRESVLKSPRTLELEVELKRTESVWLRCVVFPELGADGSLARIICIASDVTLRRKSEEALRKSLSDYRELFHRSGDVVLLVDPEDGQILDINDGAQALLGEARSEVVGSTFRELTERVSTHVFGLSEAHWKAALKPGSSFEWPLRDHAGELRWVQVVMEGLEIAGKTRLLALGRDITDLKRDSEKWVEIETSHEFLLDQNVVHEFSNLLSVILNGVELLSLASDNELREKLATVREASHRAASLTRVLVEKQSEGTRGVVLIAEDEPGVLSAVRRMLGRAGYRVLAARHGDEALEVARLHKGTIDLLLTDVVMPGVAGPRLAEEIVEIRPDVAVLYMSAYTDLVSDFSKSLGPETLLLAKPFGAEELIRAVELTIKNRVNARNEEKR